VLAHDDGFVSLAELLARDAIPASLPEPVMVATAVVEDVPDRTALLRDIRLFRARLADALDAVRDVLLRELAVAVVGRELLLAPVDLAAIATRLLAAHPAAAPVRLRVAPDDVARVAGIAPVHSDPALAPGDLIIEFADRSCDARLGVRLAAALGAWS
jgi:hypothetical protein